MAPNATRTVSPPLSGMRPMLRRKKAATVAPEVSCAPELELELETVALPRDCVVCHQRRAAELVPACGCPECQAIFVHRACLSRFRGTTDSVCPQACRCEKGELEVRKAAAPSPKPAQKQPAATSKLLAPYTTLPMSTSMPSLAAAETSQMCSPASTPSMARKTRVDALRKGRALEQYSFGSLSTLNASAAPAAPRHTEDALNAMSSKQLERALEMLEEQLKGLSDELVASLRANCRLRDENSVLSTHAEKVIQSVAK